MDTLTTYICRHCRWTLVVAHALRNSERCRGCGSRMWRAFTMPVETDQERELFKQGVTWNPGAASVRAMQKDETLEP